MSRYEYDIKISITMMMMMIRKNSDDVKKMILAYVMIDESNAPSVYYDNVMRISK